MNKGNIDYLLRKYSDGVTLSFRSGQKIPLPQYYKDKLKAFIPDSTRELVKHNSSFHKMHTDKDAYYKKVYEFCLHANLPLYNKDGITISDSVGNHIRLSFKDYQRFTAEYRQSIDYQEKNGYRQITESDTQ